VNRVSRKHLIVDTMAAFAALGRDIKGARICNNGEVVLLTDAPSGALASNDDGDWVSLAGEKDISGAAGA
jgi:hypothetical protein